MFQYNMHLLYNLYFFLQKWLQLRNFRLWIQAGPCLQRHEAKNHRLKECTL